jgi:hypothetical protein
VVASLAVDRAVGGDDVHLQRLLAKRQKLIEADEANGFAQLQMIELKQALLHKEQQKQAAKQAPNPIGEFHVDPLGFARRRTSSVLRFLFQLKAKLRPRRFPHSFPARMFVKSQLRGVGQCYPIHMGPLAGPGSGVECDYCEISEEMSRYYGEEIWLCMNA